MKSPYWFAVGLALLFSLPVTARGEESPAADKSPLGLALVDLQGTIHQLGDSDACRGMVLVFLSPDCPVSNQYMEELNRLFDSSRAQGVEFYAVIANTSRTRTAIQEHYAEQDVRFPIFFDSGGLLIDVCGPTHVPEAFVFAADGQCVYRGRIDEQFATADQKRTEAGERTLEDAVAAVVKAEAPAIERTEPVGCQLPTDPTEQVTYARHIAPLLFARCVQCHRPGEVAPFSLLTYEDAAKRADFLADVTSRRIMPPWHARVQPGDFRGERRLSLREIELIDQWAKAGAPRGNADDLPAAPQFTQDWQLGKPDLILKMSEAYDVPASGPDVFRFFVIPIEIPEDSMVAAVEFRPGNPLVVHHSVMYLDTSGVARKRDEADPGPGYEGPLTGGFRPSGTLGFWAPGYTPHFLPEDVGLLVHKGSDLAMQLHYHPSGKAETDQSQVGIYFCKKPVSRQLSGLAMINLDVDIPPGERRHRMTQSITLPIPIEVVDVTPHMHLIGTEMKVVATLPDGTTRNLVWSDWNFNWQEQYAYRQGLKLPAGTRIDLEAWYDNSDDNPFNPNRPAQRVTFGEMTTDEMCICAFRVAQSDPAERRLLSKAMSQSMMDQLNNPRVMANLMQLIKRNTAEGENVNLRDLFNGMVEEE